ncbi:uncharacterized protein BDZ99DRAFT_505483 [Mytilinidion resinicola]|uniref:Zn(2)-C6 fungal-type domain-containing protein n=1 Tax=Mytilinidion resinicola TaxID=574789 RepID=A0A6A6Z566_9PEZI|nr:uncharacterized protein BDZ99DRAFT_505483 [Mytilinidion resinicola]KAF2815803.1 hypothetical protein BDZ99DRAFT_505483 [Mytilinidion resinicola]
MSPTTPGNGAHPVLSYGNSPSSARSHGFKRPNDSDDEQDNGPEGRMAKAARQAAVKRACNECRQQKLRCNVQQDPFQECSRCSKHKLTCVIEPNFKRIGKRSRNAEMEKEMAELRARLAHYEGQGRPSQPIINTPVQSSETTMYSGNYNEEETYAGPHHQAIASLLDLRSGSPNTMKFQALEKVVLAPDRIEELFNEFFTNYHPILPFLDPIQSPEEYCNDSRLLFWTIISVAARHFAQDPTLLDALKEPLIKLIWQTVAKIPQNHFVVKALCLLCTWPLPTSRTSTDPTFMLCGLMMQIATQIGLHQPTHPQDFSRMKLRLKREDIDDRLRTWAPSVTLYDSTLDFSPENEQHMRVVPPELYTRLRQEMAADRITKLLYLSSGSNQPDKAHDSNGKAVFYANLEADRLNEEQSRFEAAGLVTDMEALNYQAVLLHLRLYAFFDTISPTGGRDDLLDLYFAATSFLNRAFPMVEAGVLRYAPNYIMQMILAAGFALLKLLNSDFAAKLPAEDGRHYLTRTITSIRAISVSKNDLPLRLAEVLAQLWKASGGGSLKFSSTSQSPGIANAPLPNIFAHQPPPRRGSPGMDDPLRLRVRSRMSMSVVFDSVWRWRETQVNGAGENLDTTVVNNPTNPDSSTNSTPPAGMPMEGNLMTNQLNQNLSALSMPLAMPNGLASANSYEFFDPVSWMLDVQPDWNVYGGSYGADFGA